jgi:hypothetical protein
MEFSFFSTDIYDMFPRPYEMLCNHIKFNGNLADMRYLVRKCSSREIHAAYINNLEHITRVDLTRMLAIRRCWAALGGVMAKQGGYAVMCIHLCNNGNMDELEYVSRYCSVQDAISAHILNLKRLSTRQIRQLMKIPKYKMVIYKLEICAESMQIPNKLNMIREFTKGRWAIGLEVSGRLRAKTR